MLNQLFTRKLFMSLKLFKKFFSRVIFRATFDLILVCVTINSDSSSEVSKLHLPVSENKNVLWLQVNIHNILRV